MENLNDDCQLRIIGHLGLKDQLKLWEATAHIASSRLPGNIIYQWQRKSKYVLDETILAYLEEHPNQLKGFLTGMSETVQQLELQYITSFCLHMWIGYSYRNLWELNFSLNDSCEEIEQLVHSVLVDIFPNLTSVELSGGFYSEIIEKWPELRRLDLSGCFCPPIVEVSMSNFLKLEEILIQNDFLIKEFIDDTVVLPNLRSICFYGEDRCEDTLNWIIDKRGEHIRRAIFNDSIWYCSMQTLERMKHLHQLTLFEDNGFEAYQLKTLLKNMPQLKQLDLVKIQIWRSERELWKVVSQCGSLQVLNIYGMQIDDSFFDLNRSHMIRVLNKRSTPLLLLHDNNNPRVNGNNFLLTYIVNKMFISIAD